MELEDQNAATDYKSFASMMQSGVLASGTGIGAGSSLFGKSILGSGLRNSIRSMSIASQTVLDEVKKYAGAHTVLVPKILKSCCKYTYCL